MSPEQFIAVLEGASEQQLETLDLAHWRYMTLIGLLHDGVPTDVAAQDQTQYAHLIKPGSDGKPVFHDEDCEKFMADITGLSPEVCAAWRDFDFFEQHGETPEQMDARLAASA